MRKKARKKGRMPVAEASGRGRRETIETPRSLARAVTRALTRSLMRLFNGYASCEFSSKKMSFVPELVAS